MLEVMTIGIATYLLLLTPNSAGANADTDAASIKVTRITSFIMVFTVRKEEKVRRRSALLETDGY
jgi:hypothetical protein